MNKLYDRAEIYDLIESEKRSEIIRRDWKQEIFEEHYYPFSLSIVKKRLSDLGYDELYLRPVPCDIPETDFEKMDWYRVIARKPLDS